MIIEAVVLKYLQGQGIKDVYCERPEVLPSEYVLIAKTGSSLTNHVNCALVAIQSISSKSLLAAAELNEKVKSLILKLPWAANVFSVKLNSDYNYTNTNTKEYRYQAVFEIYY